MGDYKRGRSDPKALSGAPERDPDPYDREDFSWRLVEKPAESRRALEYDPTPYDDRTQYDEGLYNTVEFQPDGTHELTIEAFPPIAGDDEQSVFDVESEGGVDSDDGVGGHDESKIGGPPHLELVGEYDPDSETFVVESNPELAADSFAFEDDLEVSFRPHDAASRDRADMRVEGTTAKIPIDALAEPTSLFAAPYDGIRLGATDEIVIDPDAETVRYPNRPPEWLDDAVMYEIFPRSFAGPDRQADFEFMTEKVDYLADVGVDVVWVTPIVPAWSAEIDMPPGGPHGYDTGDYFAVAEDLGTLEDFEQFVDACHERDIRVCFDLVVNHCGWTNDYWQDTIAELGAQPDDEYAFPEIEAWDHDESRIYWEAKAEGHREDPAQTERAALAAGFTLPGSPFIYYGQERLVCEYGTRRESPFADRDDRFDDIEKDPYKRAFMNWDEYDEEHFAFVDGLNDFYHDSSVLGPDADLVREGYRTDAESDVLVFGRDAGAEKRVVVINFGAEPREVQLRAAVDTRDLFTASDLAVDTHGDAVTVEVDTLAVFETQSLIGA